MAGKSKEPWPRCCEPRCKSVTIFRDELRCPSHTRRRVEWLVNRMESAPKARVVFKLPVFEKVDPEWGIEERLALGEFLVRGMKDQTSSGVAEPGDKPVSTLRG